jgi:hypothetical protein
VAVKLLIVQNLGVDKMILGRDFIQMYDVLVDIPQQQVTMRNPDMKYRLQPVYTPMIQRGVFQATVAKATMLPPLSIHACTMNVKRRKKDPPLPLAKRWLAYTEDMEICDIKAQGVSAGHALTVVSGHSTRVLLLNAHMEQTTDPPLPRPPEAFLTPQMSAVQLSPVTVS